MHGLLQRMYIARLNHSDAKHFKVQIYTQQVEVYTPQTTKGDMQMIQHHHCIELLEEIFTKV